MTVNVSSLLDSQNQFESAVVSMVDMTELKLLSEQLLVAKEEADAKTGRLGEADDAPNSPAKPRPVRVWAETRTRGSALLGS